MFTRRTHGCNTTRNDKLTRTFQITTTTAGEGGMRASEEVRGIYPGCTRDGRDGLTLGPLRWKIRRFSSDCAGLTGCRFAP